LSELFNGEDGKFVSEVFSYLLSSLPINLVSSTKVRCYGTLLQDAVSEGKRAHVQAILEHGVDPAAVTGDQHDSPTEIAINKEDLAVLKILANFTEVPNKIKHKQLRIMLDREKKGSPSTEFCNLLHSVPADELPDLALAWGESTLVQIAARDGMKDHLPLLLSHGLDPVAKSADSSFSALDWAIQNTDQEVFHLLVSHMKDGPLRTLVQLAFCATVEEEGEPSHQFETLLNQISPSELDMEAVMGQTVLQNASKQNKSAHVVLLLKHGANPEGITESDPDSPLLIAMRYQAQETFLELAKFTKVPDTLKDLPFYGKMERSLKQQEIA